MLYSDLSLLCFSDIKQLLHNQSAESEIKQAIFTA